MAKSGLFACAAMALFSSAPRPVEAQAGPAPPAGHGSTSAASSVRQRPAIGGPTRTAQLGPPARATPEASAPVPTQQDQSSRPEVRTAEVPHPFIPTRAPAALPGAPSAVAADHGTAVAGTSSTSFPSVAGAAGSPLPAAYSISFDEAVRSALARNPTAVVAAEEVRRAEALATETRAGWLPTLYGNAMYTRLDHDRVLSGRVISGADQLSANVTLTVPLIMPQKWAASSRANDQIDVARASRADVRRQLAVAVGRAYLLVVSQKRVLEVNESALATAQAHYDYSRIRHQGGLGNRVDVVRAEQEVATDQSLVETARTALVRAREALGVLVGTLEGVDAVEPALESPSPLPRALEEADTRRADVQAGRERVRAARRSSSLDWTDYAPFLSAMLQPFYQNPPTLVNPLTGWQAQLMLTVPFYDGGLRTGLAHEREALTAEARANLDGVLRQAHSDVRAGFEAVIHSESGLEAAQRASRLAAQALELATVAYRAGATSNLEMIDAERRSRDAAIQMTIAEDTLRQARLDLLAASGRFPGY